MNNYNTIKTVFVRGVKMRKNITILFLCFSILALTACSTNKQAEEKDSQVAALEEQIEQLKIENNQLKVQNEQLKNQAKRLSQQLRNDSDRTQSKTNNVNN